MKTNDEFACPECGAEVGSVCDCVDWVYRINPEKLKRNLARRVTLTPLEAAIIAAFRPDQSSPGYTL